MIDSIINKDNLDEKDLLYLIKLEDELSLNKLYSKAYEVKEKYIGRKAYFRGLIEFSNICVKDCFYCGIRKSNNQIESFSMDQDAILKMANWAYDNQYGSITLQSGERYDDDFIEFCSDTIKKIKAIGDGSLGMTLCLGEQTKETYQKWFNAGAQRYLLRIETTNQELFEKIHPKDELHSYNKRLNALETLKEIGYQVGTGVMIGLPNQTHEDLVKDIIFFKNNNIDMIGMGPYVVSKDTPLGKEAISNGLNTPEVIKERFNLGLKMIAVTRLYLKDVNIAATTALQALDPLGREKGLKAGANILMPIITADEHRAKYQLYDDKPCIDDSADHCKICLSRRVASVGDTIGFNEQGNAPHYYKRIAEENK